MAKTPVRAVTDDELLSGDDDAADQERDDALSELDAGDTDLPSGEDPAKGDGQEDFEVEIIADDEGQEAADTGDGGAAADAGESTPGIDDLEDGGEPIGQDYLTDWEKKNHSKAMQKRINRERRLKEEERRARQDAEAKLETEIAARRTAESNARTNMKYAMAMTVRTLDGDIEKKMAELRKAKEAGETDKEVALDGELDELRAKRRTAKAHEEALEKEQPVAAATPDKAKAPANPLAERWMGRNRWFSDPQFATDAQYARLLDAEIFKEKKLSPNSPEYFVEFDRRIHQRMPTLRARIQKVFGAAQSGGKPNAPSSMPVMRGGGAAAGNGAGGKNKVQLDRADLQNMREFGMDPKNKAHLREYASQKLARIRNGG